MNLPKRKTRQKMGLRVSEIVRCAGHLQWVRRFACLVSAQSYIGDGIRCSGNTEAHHLQCYRASEGGMGMKVGDNRVIPLCCAHHEMIHRVGHDGFERVYGKGIADTAEMLWQKSPHRLKWEQKQQQSQS